MSINLVPEDALPKSSYLEAELGLDRDPDGCEPDRRGDGKEHPVARGASVHGLSPDETFPPGRG